MSGTVSVVVPTYRRNDSLRAAIASVRDQTYVDVEVVVVDDSGEAHAEPVVAEFPGVEYVALPENRGAPAARVRGYEETDGRYVQFLDDDDELAPEKFARQVALLEDDPGLGAVYCGIDARFGGEVRPSDRDRPLVERALTFDPTPCVTTTLLFRRTALEAVEPFDGYEGAQDTLLILKLTRESRIGAVDDLLVSKGGPEYSLGASREAVSARRQLVADFADLYDEYPPAVRRRALAKTYLLEGNLQLNEKRWSSGAIRSFYKAVYYHPDPGPQYLALLVLSPFGRYGRAFGRWAASRTT